MRMIEIEFQKNSVELNLVLAQKKLAEGDTELAAHRIEDARKALNELFKEIKKAN